MPTYEYECNKCSHRFEVFQSMKDEALKLCPECGGEIHRLINGGAGVIYKGGGFYCTDKGLPRSGKNTQAPAASEKKPAPAPCAACKKAESGACGAA